MEIKTEQEFVAAFGESFASVFDRESLQERLREQGIHPDDVAALVKLAPLALTHMCWRNSVLEDWHADRTRPLSDADMFRANVETTKLFSSALAGWVHDSELRQGACLADVAQLDPASFASYLGDAIDDATFGDRCLPHGVRLAEIAGEELEDLQNHAYVQLDGLEAAANVRGLDTVLLFLASRGDGACGTWWGGRWWPWIVDRWLRLLDDPTDEFWRGGRHPGNPPATGEDRAWLRRTLLSAPETLTDDVAGWCVGRAMLGFVRPPGR
jgi:hypothetical protein